MNNNLIIPIKIGFKNIVTCINTNKIVFVGGIADHIHLRNHTNIKVNDIDLLFNDFSDIGYFKKYYGLDFDFEATRFYTSRHISRLDFKTDGILNIDFFEKKTMPKGKLIEKVKFLNEDIFIVTKEYMYTFHKFQVEKNNDRNKHLHKMRLYELYFKEIKPLNFSDIKYN